VTENIKDRQTQKATALAADGSKPSEVEVLNTEVLADRHFRYELLTLRTGTFAGKLSQPFKREVLRSGQAVVVLLYDPAAHRLILIEQFRVGAYLNHLSSAWILECVAGMVDEGETTEAAARREVQEETGCEVGKMEYIGAYLSSPGLSDELVTVYVGEVDATRAGGIHGHEAEGEDIRTIIFSVEDALAAGDDGAVVNVMAQVALLWFARHGDALRERWRGSATD
jgi:ADP-ribose pyrophosphatase